MWGSATRVVLKRWGTRVVVEPGDVVESEVKLSGSFIAFDSATIERYDAQIKAQEAHIQSTIESNELQRKEILARHKSELQAFDANSDANVKLLRDRLQDFICKKEVLSKNIDKATSHIDGQIESLSAKKASLEKASTSIGNTDVPVEMTVNQMKDRLDELGVVYPERGLKKSDYEALLAKAEANAEQKADATSTDDTSLDNAEGTDANGDANDDTNADADDKPPF